MIYYEPTSGDPSSSPIPSNPKTCFLMTQLGGELHPDLVDMRGVVEAALVRHDFECIDANSRVTGRDFLLKIWQLVISVPVGIALIHESMSRRTLANIFYELGLMHAYGKDTLVLKSPDAEVPSDFIRTEYVQFDDRAPERLGRFMEEVEDRPNYFGLMADQLEKNPVLSIDFLRRAFLVSGDASFRQRALEIFDSAGLAVRAKNSVEALLAQF